MDRFQTMSVFVAVAEEQGFAAAARRLNMSPPAVTRSVASLEDHLGVKLLQRSTRYVRTTEAGLRYLDDARRILLELEAADATAAGINATPRGQLAVTAPVLFGRLFVMPGVVEYLKQYSETYISVMFLDRVVNLLEEGMDVGVRIGKLPDSSMHALQVASVRIVLCASPAYLQEHGAPESPDDLHKHRMLASIAGNHLLDLRFKTLGREREMQILTRLTTNTNDSAIEAALQGYGITRLISYQVAEHLETGELQTVLEDWEPDPLPVNILYREGRQAAAKVRTFVDFIAARLRENPALN
jgi:DNA-binding transcriptional LysR family regulator